VTEPRRDPGWLRRWWIAWTVLAGVLLLVGFGVPEVIAIADPGQGGTYTESLQEWLGTTDGGAGWGWWALAAVLVGFVAWFLPHLRGWWPWERRRE
jgi:hypothetical protein